MLLNYRRLWMKRMLRLLSDRPSCTAVGFSCTCDPEFFFKVLRPALLKLGALQTQPTTIFRKSSRLHKLEIRDQFAAYALFTILYHTKDGRDGSAVSWKRIFRNGS